MSDLSVQIQRLYDQCKPTEGFKSLRPYIHTPEFRKWFEELTKTAELFLNSNQELSEEEKIDRTTSTTVALRKASYDRTAKIMAFMDVYRSWLLAEGWMKTLPTRLYLRFAVITVGLRLVYKLLKYRVYGPDTDRYLRKHD